MANGDLTPDNIQFQQEDYDPAVTPQQFQGLPSDDEYDLMLKEFSDSVNNIVYPTGYDPEKNNSFGPTGPNYNPYKSNVDLSDTEETLLKRLNEVSSGKGINKKPLVPIMTNKRLTNYERYYNHPKFNELKFNPFRDNETLYNENSGFMDDFSRMMGQFPKLLYTGFVSSYRSLGDLFDDDSYFTGKDLDSAREFSDAMRIGNSTKGGVGGFMNNLVLQSGYTFGIISNIAVEEAILSFVTGGGSLFTAPLRGAKKAGDIVKNMTRIPQITANTGKTVDKLKDVDNARTFWSSVKSGDNRFMSFLLPETMKSRQLLNSTNNAVNNLSDIAKGAKTFGGFYRDFRSLNFALAEGKMEGGMVYDERIANGLASRMEVSESGMLTDEDFQIIRDGANKASFYTTTLNAPFIYFTNQLLLGNAFGSYNRSLARMLEDNTDALAKRILRNKPVIDKAGKVVDGGLARKVAPGIRGKLEKTFSEGLIRGSASGALRYFAANFGEGVQEVYQEAVAHGTGHYYDALIKDPTLGTRNLFQSSLSNAMSSQISSQGFHTFMSGFMMGGLVGPVQNFVFSGVPNFTQKYITNREQYKKDQVILETAIDNAVKEYNSLWSAFKSDPSKFLDLKVVDTIIQKQVSEDKQVAMDNDNKKDFLTSTDIAKFQNAYSLVSTGAANMFRDQLKDYLKLSDEDLQTAFPALQNEVKDGKIKERINSHLKDIDRIEDLYNQNKNKFINPFDPSMFDMMTQPVEFIQETLKYEAYNHIRYLAMFSQNQLIRSGERLMSLFQELESDPLYKDMAANDITLLLSENSLGNEIKNLKNEIENLDDSAENKESKNQKTQKLKDLEDINDFLQEKHEVIGRLKNRKSAKGKQTEIDWRKQGKLKKLFVKYMNNLAKSKGQSIDELRVDDYLKKIFDYSQLQIDEAKYRNSVLALSDPQKFEELFDSAYMKKKEIFENGIKIYRETIEKHVNNQNIKNFLNGLAEKGVYIEPDEVIAFVSGQTYDIEELKTFYNVNGEIINDKKLILLIKLYKESLSKILIKEKTKDDQSDESEFDFVSDVIKENISNHGLRLPNVMTDEEHNSEANFSNSLFDKLYDRWYKEGGLSKEEFIEKYKFEIEELLSALIVVAHNKDLEAIDLLSIASDYVNGNLDKKYTNFINAIFESSIKDLEHEQVRQAINDLSEIEKEEEDPEFVEIEKETQPEAGETKEKLKRDSRVFPELGGMEIVVYRNEKDGKFYLTFKKSFLPENLKVYLFDSTYRGKRMPYDTQEAATEALMNLKRTVKGKVFKINGKEFSQNNTVYDNKGNGFKITDITPILFDNKIEVNNKFYSIKTFLSHFTRNKSNSTSNSITSVNNSVEIIKNSKLSDENFKIIMMYFNLMEEDVDSYFDIYIDRNSLEPNSSEYRPNKRFKANDNIKRIKAPYNIQIRLTEEGINAISSLLEIEFENNLVGYINSGNLMYLNGNEVEVKTLKMTEEQSEMYYENMDSNKYNALINNFASVKVLVSKMNSLLGNEESKTLTPKQFTEATGIKFISTPKYDYNKAKPNSLRDLRFYDEGKVVIFRNVTDKDSLSSTWVVVEGSNINLKELNKYKDFANNTKDKQGYVAFGQLPNGEIFYIPLKSNNLTEEEVAESFKKIKDFANSEDINISDFNENIDLFLSLNPYQYLNIYFDKDKNFIVSFNKKDKGDKFTFTRKFTKEDLNGISSFEVLLNELNEGIKNNYKGKDKIPTLSIASFRRNFPKDASIEEVIDGTKTDLGEDIFERYNFKIQADTQDIENVKKQPEDSQDNVNKKNESAGQNNKGEEEKRASQIKKWKSLLKEYDEGDHAKLKTLAYRRVFQGRKGVTAPDMNEAKNIQLITNYTALYGELIKAYEALDKTLESFDKEKVLAGKPNLVSVYEMKVSYTYSNDPKSPNTVISINIKWEKTGEQDFTNKKMLELNEYTIGELLNYDKFLEEDQLEDQEIALYSSLSRDELIAEKKKLKKEIEVLRRPLREAKKNNNVSRLEDLQRQREELESKIIEINSLINKVANLIISDNHSQRSVEDINIFIKWLQENLPDFISISDINQLKNNMLRGGTRVGAFMIALKNISGKMRIGGTLYTSKSSPGKYHEAFHAVFRLLLTDKEISKYIKVGKKELKEYLKEKGKNYKTELSNFRNKSKEYDSLSEKDLEDLFIEEYIAERFDEFKSNPKKTKTHFSLKSLFNRFIEIIKSVVGKFIKLDNKPYNSLNELFTSIDSGKYRSANLMDNRFTNEFRAGSSPIVNSLIPYDSIGDEVSYLDSITGEAIINQIYSRVIVQEEKSKTVFNIEKSIDESIGLYINLYESTASPTEKSDQVLDALENYSSAIKEEVLERLKFSNLTQNKLDELEDEELNETGITTNDYNKKAELVGIEKSLPAFVRKYIASTTIESEDVFGNKYLTKETIDKDGNVIPGERIVTSVNFADVYSGFLRGTNGIFDHGEMLLNMVLFSENGNPETKAVVDRLLLDINVSRTEIIDILEEGGADSATILNLIIGKGEKEGNTNASFFHKLFKAFENSRFKYRFSKYNSEKETVESYDQVSRGVQSAQLQSWFNGYLKQYNINKNSQVVKKKSIELLQEVQLILGANADYKDSKLNEISKEISEKIYKATGVLLHPKYVFYSLSSDVDIKEYGIQRYYSAKYDKTIKIDSGLIANLQNSLQNDYFIYANSDSFSKELFKYSRANTLFDESIGSTTFLNPENERIYAHQLPTLNAKFVYEITKSPEAFLDALVKDNPILKYNYLAGGRLGLSEEMFDQFIGMIYSEEFSYERIGGLIQETINKESISKDVLRDGKSYGKLEMEDFLKVLISNYYANIEFNGSLKSKSAPIFTRVAETSRTGAAYQLQIIDSVDHETGANLTDTVIQIFKNYIHGEFERIQKESDVNVDSELIEGYNAVQNSRGILVRDTKKEGTAYRLYKTKAFLNNNTQLLDVREEPINSKLAYETIGNSSQGILAVGKTTDLGKMFSSEFKDFSVEVTIKKSAKSKDSVKRIFTFQEVSGNKYLLKFQENFDEFVDDELTTQLEKLAQDPKNKGKDFREIIESVYGTEKFDELIEDKLEAEFSKFLKILEDNNIDINDSFFYTALNGAWKDLSPIKEEDKRNRIETRLGESTTKLNLKRGDIQNNLKQMFFNHYINSFSINQLIRGDHAMLYPNYQAEIKRGKDAEGHFTSTRSYLYDETLDVNKPVTSFDLIVLEEILNKSSISGEDIKVADGQLWMTVNAFRQAWFGIGELTPFQNEILRKIERGEKLSIQDVWGKKIKGRWVGGLVSRKEMLNPKKFLYSDAQTMVKMSAYVLRKEDTSILQNGKWVAKDNMIVLHNLRESLEAHELKTGEPTMAAPTSSLKKMKKHINNLEDALKSRGQLNVMKLDASYFGRQQVNPSNKTLITDPTQITYLLENEQNDEQWVIINGEELQIKDIKEAFEKNKSDILKLNYGSKRNLVFDNAVKEFKVFKDNGDITPNMLTFLNYALESLKLSNSASDILQFFDISKESDFQSLLNNPRVIKKYEDLLLSYFSKSVLKQKIPGSQLTMITDFGSRIYRRVYSVREVNINGEIYYIPDRQEVIREQIALRTVKDQYKLHIDMSPSDVGNKKISNPGNEIKNLKGLKELVEEAGEEGVLIIDRMRYDMPEYSIDENTGEWKPSGKKYSEAKIAISDPEVYKKYGEMHQDKEYIFTSAGLETMYKEWKSNKNILKDGEFIAREDKPGWNDKKGKLTFAKEMKTWYNKKTNKFEEVRYTNIPEALSKIFALRIPTQDKHSALAVRAVDFMSVSNGSSIITAREIVEVSGADFDIDKLFAQFKEYYFDEKRKDFVEMGLDPEKIFYEYILYVNKKVNEQGTVYFEAYQKYQEQGESLGSVELTTRDKKIAENLGMDEKAMLALTLMGMPITPEDFQEFETDYGYHPFEAIMHNKVLDYKSAMVSNDSVTNEQDLYIDKDGMVTTNPKGNKKLNITLPAVAYEPADMKPLEKALEDFKKIFPKWAKTVLEDIFDNDTMTGAMLAFQNNRIGSSLIGASALPNTYLPKLGTLGIKINSKWELSVNGVKFNKYGTALERKGESDFGYRTQYVMSALITAMTDNATKQYAGKFRININSLGILSNLVMLGVPLQTSLMMTMNPEILNMYSEHTTGSSFKYKLSSDLSKIKKLEKQYNFSLSDNVTNNQLETLINSKFSLKNIFEKVDNKKKLTSEEQKHLQDMYSLLINYQKGNDLAQYNFNLGTLFGLVKGINKTEKMTKIDEAINNLGLNSEKLKDEEHPYDAKEIFINDNPLNKIAKTNYDIYKDLSENVMSELVLTQTKSFKALYENIINTKTGMLAYSRKDGREKLKYDLASYLIAKKYLEKLNIGNYNHLDSLNNNIIYPFNKEGETTTKSIIDVIQDEILKDDELQDNFFLNEFINYLDTSLNQEGINKLENNFMSKLPDNRKRDIQDEFIKLYKNQETKIIAEYIFDYLLVKDGLQYSRNSILQAISPLSTPEFYKEATEEVFREFRDAESDVNLLYEEFINNYFLSASVYFSGNFGLKKIGSNKNEITVIDEDIPFKNIKDQRRKFLFFKNDNLFINPFGVSEISGKVAIGNKKIKNEELKEAKDVLSNFGVYSQDVNKRILFKFPPIVQAWDGQKYVTYKLKSLVTNDESNFSLSFTKKKSLYLGYAAEYEIAKPKGSKDQWGGGFVFGERIDNEALGLATEFGSVPDELLEDDTAILGDDIEEKIEILPFSFLNSQRVKDMVDSYLVFNNYQPKDFGTTLEEMYKDVENQSEIVDEDSLNEYLKCNYVKF